MGREWPIVRLGDLADSISCTHKFEKDQLIFLNTSDILMGEILHDSYTAIKDWPGQAKKSIRKNDILFSEIRPANGRYAFVNMEADDFVVSTKLMVIRTKRDRITPKFLYHFLTSKSTTGWLQHLAESRSGTFPQITFDQVADLQIPLPPRHNQEDIVSFLETLDDRMSLNRRINETLEAMARAIFKSWFVDFDPVYINQARKGKKVTGKKKDAATNGFTWNPDILALFPDSFEESALGTIPKGWHAQLWGDLATLEYGKGLRGYRDANGAYRVYGTNGAIGWHTKPLCPTEGIIIGRKGAYRGVHFSPEPFYVIDTAFYLKAKGRMSVRWALYAIRTHDINAMDSGSAIPSTSREAFYGLPVCSPPPSLMDEFDEIATPLFSRQFANQRNSTTLASIRDALLPKLLSSEIRVAEAEKLVEEVA